MAQQKYLSQEYAELANKINEFFGEVDITVQDLRNPTPDAVSRFYNAFLDELGVSTSNLLQIQMNQMTLISHVDMYNATVPLLNLYHGINYFFRGLNVTDFVLTDLTNPNPKRTLVHFKTIMSFVNYCDYAISNYNDEVDNIVKMRKQRNELISKIELVRGELINNATERVKRQEEIELLKESIEFDTQKMNEIMKERQVNQDAVEGKKKSFEQALEKESEAIRLIKNLEVDIRELQGMLVTSPDKLKSELAALTQKKEDCLESLKNLKMQIEEKQKLNHDLLKKQEEQKNRQEMIKTFLEMKNVIEDITRKYESLVANHNKLIEKRQDDVHKIEELKKNEKKLQANLMELMNMKVKQDADMKDEIKESERKFNIICSAMKEQKAHKDHLQMQINILHEELNEKRKEYELYRGEYHKISKKLTAMTNSLIEAYKKLMVEMDSF